MHTGAINKQKIVPGQIFASYESIIGHYSHQAGGLPLLEERGVAMRKGLSALSKILSLISGSAGIKRSV